MLLVGLAVVSFGCDDGMWRRESTRWTVEPDARPPNKAKFTGKTDAAAVAR